LIDYKDNENLKITTLSSIEFLRRFCMPILAYRFVKILYYGILGSRHKQQVQPLKDKPEITKAVETKQQRMVRLTGFDPCNCPRCKTGTKISIEELPKIRSPFNVFYPNAFKHNC